MKTVTSILAIVLVLSCQTDSSAPTDNSTSSNIEELPLIKKHFNQDEIAALAQLKLFFEEQICPASDNNLTKANLPVCYENYIKAVQERINLNRELFQIDYAAYRQLLKTGTTDSLIANWYQVADSVRSYGNFSPTGKYFQYLEDLSEKNELAAAYYNRLSRINDVASPSMWGLMTTPAVFNYDDPSDQLVIALHYLTWLENDKISERFRNLYPDKGKLHRLRQSQRDTTPSKR